MKRTLILIGFATMLAGCASKGPQPTAYDFGPLGAPLPAAGAAASAMPAIAVAEVTGPASLDTQRMHYRLLYADARQSRPYAYNTWAATPLQLMSQRLKARIAQAGVKVVSGSDTAGGVPLLRLEADEFAQNFDSTTQSSASITLRASLFRDHKLVDQRSFTRSARAPSADAAGGASALADSTDGLATDILAWLATLPRQ